MPLDDGNLESPADSPHILVEDIDRHVARSLNGGDARLRDSNALRELSLRETSLLTEHRQTRSKAQPVFDRANSLRHTGCLEDPLLPCLRTHRFLPFAARLVGVPLVFV